MFRKIELKEGAYIVSDAHFSSSRPQLQLFLEAIVSEQLQPAQLILMGDIFDALFGSIPHTYKEKIEVIKLLQNIAKKIEVIYLEGNHDFNLKAVFDNVTIVPIKQQPLHATFKTKGVWLAHGDFDAPFGYQLYTALIRNPLILKILRPIDALFGHFILNFVDKHLGKKDDCKQLEWFAGFIEKRFDKKLECDYFIEGHFHQNKSFDIGKTYYTNLGAFACNQRYFVVKSMQENMILEEKKFSKES
ncbi:MAG: UDP-2,3-diacylglucosamine diphosphatase [Epsilonproteobacteria bacterium]|nr:UDP-2,3-diacylglucosamine diphosphatase [Campylobacterota bacterium]